MSDVAEKPKVIEETDIGLKLAEPPLFAVVFHNDEQTPVDFVAGLIHSIFGKPIETAYQLTMKVHVEGSAFIDVFDYEIAEEKKIECDNASQHFGFPLKVTIEEQE